MLPPAIPIFPLPNVVLFPNVFLPLHIFEPRYREMVADALAGDRIIGVVLLRPGWEPEYDGRPPVYAVGCAGVVTNAERLPDGRYNIVLQGLEKFRIVDEDASKPYRIAHVEGLPESGGMVDRDAMREARRRLEDILVPRSSGGGAEPTLPPSMADEDLVNALAQYLDLDVLEHQALLECDGVLARCRALINLLEMKLHAPQGGWTGKVFH